MAEDKKSLMTSVLSIVQLLQFLTGIVEDALRQGETDVKIENLGKRHRQALADAKKFLDDSGV